MKKLVASVAALALTLSMLPVNLIAAARQDQTATGQISGTAAADGKPMAQVEVRLRNIDNNEIIRTSQTNAQGQFQFTGLPAGNFVVETYVNGVLVSTSTTIKLVAGAMIVAGVALNTTAAAASAAAAGVAGAAAGGGALGAVGGTLGAVALASGAIAATAIVVTQDDSSPSQ